MNKKQYQLAKVKIISFREDIICSSDNYTRDIYEPSGWQDENMVFFQK